MQTSKFPIALTRKMMAYKVSFKAFIYTFTLLSSDSRVKLLFSGEELTVPVVGPVRLEYSMSRVEFILGIGDTVIVLCLELL